MKEVTVKPVEAEPKTVEEHIIESCERYNIDSDIPLAIAKLETGHFTSEAYTECNNVGGMLTEDGVMEFASVKDGVSAFVGNLAENYFGQGLTTPEAMSEKYCPHTPKAWAREVRKLL